MGTTARRFYPHSAEWDGTDPASGDVRTMETALPAATSGSSCNFGTSGAKTITIDPYTAGRTTTGLDSKFGWAIDIAGADGMDGAVGAHRYIPAGTWLYQGTLFSPSLAVAPCTVAMSVYRVAAAPSTVRTLLFTDAGVTVPDVAVLGTAFTRTTAAQAEIELQPGETVQCTFTLTCTGQLLGLTIDFRTGDLASDCWVDLPAPGVGTVHDEPAATSGGGDWRRYNNPLPPHRPPPKVKKKKRRRLLDDVTFADGAPLVVHAATVEEAFALLVLASS